MNAPAYFTYRLSRLARTAVTVPANAYRMPLHAVADYARARQCDDWLDGGNGGDRDELRRVLLDHVQYFGFLAELTTRIRARAGATTLLFVEVCAPYFGSLPLVLLEPGVLLGSGVFNEASWHAELGGAGAPVVWLDDRFLRDLDYAGDNTLRCAVWPASLAPAIDAALRSDWSHYAVELHARPHFFNPPDSGADAPPGSTHHE
jgi:hypothetical protein